MIEAHIDDREIDKLIKNIKGWQTETRRRIIDELKVSGLVIEGDAKRRIDANGTTNLGRLKTSIGRKTMNGGLTQVVGSGLKYAPHVEFGTRPHFPPLAPIKAWAKRKLNNEKAAWPVAKKISEKGTKPQPFLFPAYEAERPKLIENLKRILKRK